MNKVLVFIFIIINSLLLIGCNSSSKIDKLEDAYGTYIYIGYSGEIDNNQNRLFSNKEIEPEVFVGEYSNEKYEFAVMLKEAVGDQIVLTKDFLKFTGEYDSEIPFDGFFIGRLQSRFGIDRFSLPEEYKILEITFEPQYEKNTIIWYDIAVRASIHFGDYEEHIDLDLKLNYRKGF